MKLLKSTYFLFCTYYIYSQLFVKVLLILNIIIIRFNKQVINVLITSDILEDGVDFKNCKYVIRYDTPKSLLFYIQSKRRAYSKFIILMPVQFESQFKRIHSEYIEMEEEINKVCLVCNYIF